MKMRGAAFTLCLLALWAGLIHAQSCTVENQDVITCNDANGDTTSPADDDDYDFYVVAPPDTSIECSGDPRTNAHRWAQWADPNMFGYGYEASGCYLGWCDDDDNDSITVTDVNPSDDDDDTGAGANEFLWEENSNSGGWLDSPEQRLCGPSNYARQLTRSWYGMHLCEVPPTVMVVNQVISLVDSIPPYIDAPRDITVECGTPLTDAHLGAPFVSDACWAEDPEDMLTLATPLERSSFLNTCSSTGLTDTDPFPGVLIRGWTASDSCNAATAEVQQTITVVDTIPPFIDGIDDIFLECAPVADPPDASVFGNGPHPSVSNELTPSIVYVCPNTNKILAIKGQARMISLTFLPLELQSSAEIEYTASDCSGNTATASITRTVKDTKPPVIVVTGTNTPLENLFAEINCKTWTIQAAEVYDNCPPAPTLDEPLAIVWEPANEKGDYLADLVYRAVDVCGNSATVQQSVLAHVVADLSISLVSISSGATITKGADTTILLEIANSAGSCNSENFVIYFDAWPATIANSGAACWNTNAGPGENQCLGGALNAGDSIQIAVVINVPTSHQGTHYDASFRVDSLESRDENPTNNVLNLRIPLV